MSSMRFSAHLDRSHHRLLHLFEDARVIANCLTGIHNVVEKRVFVVNRSCIHKGF
jgi:hypothetical protein